MPFLSVEKLDSGKELVVKDGCEILVPKPSRKGLLDKLHFTHLSTDAMLRMCKGSFFWPGLKSNLNDMYKACDACLTNSKGKMDKTCSNIPPDLISMMPGEELAKDFCDIFGKNVLVVCDRVTSHIYAEVTKDKSFESAKGVMLTYFHTYGLPYKISSDGGPSFRSQWLAWLDKMSINPPHNLCISQSAERFGRKSYWKIESLS